MLPLSTVPFIFMSLLCLCPQVSNPCPPLTKSWPSSSRDRQIEISNNYVTV
jgi:hypothetical protein